jgi:hypothetical protein
MTNEPVDPDSKKTKSITVGFTLEIDDIYKVEDVHLNAADASFIHDKLKLLYADELKLSNPMSAHDWMTRTQNAFEDAEALHGVNKSTEA